MRITKYAEAVSTALAWTAELRARNGRVNAEHLAAAYGAGFELMQHPATKESERVLTALRAELAIAEAVRLDARLSPSVDAVQSEDDPDEPLPEKPRLTALLGGAARQEGWSVNDLADSLEQMSRGEGIVRVENPPPWDGWSGPAPVLAGETSDDIAERVAADLDGAAALLAELMVEPTTVPEPVASRASGNILRALSLGAMAIRAQLGGRPRITVTDRSEPNAELMAEIQALGTERDAANADRNMLRNQVREARAELERESARARQLAADVTESGMRRQEIQRERDSVTELAEKRAQTLRLRERELAEARDRGKRLADQLARRTGPDAVALKSVLRALGTWAPGYEEMSPEELAATAQEVAKRVVNDAAAKRTELVNLRETLNKIPGVGPAWGRTGTLVERIQAAVATADQRRHALEHADDWKDRAEAAEREAGASASEASAWRTEAERLRVERNAWEKEARERRAAQGPDAP